MTFIVERTKMAKYDSYCGTGRVLFIVKIENNFWANQNIKKN